MSILSRIKKFFSFGSRNIPAGSAADRLIFYVIGLINPGVESWKFLKFEPPPNLPPAKREAYYAQAYLKLEDFITKNRPPLTKKVFTKESLRQEIKSAINIKELPEGLRVIFLDEAQRRVLLFEIVTKEFVSYIASYIGEQSLHDVLESAARGSAFSRLAVTAEGAEGINFSGLDPIPAGFSAKDITSYFKSLYLALYEKIVESFGKPKALEMVRAQFEFIKNVYGPELSAQFFDIVPEGILELERLAFMSREELERKVRERTLDLQELNENLEIKVKERTKELTEANSRLVELDRLKSEFVSIAAHQLRTPLTGIRWSLKSLLQSSEAFSDEQKHIIEDAVSASSRLSVLVDDLLDASRIEEGKLGITKHKQPFALVLQSIFKHFEILAKEKNITYALDLPSEGLPEISFDAEQVSIILENFLDNAVKYTEGGSIKVKAFVEGAYLVVSVADTGIGITSGQAANIFSKFFRSPNAKLKNTGGTGLGLYISKKIAEMHGGKVWFDSEEGKGSTFYLTLPIS